MIDQKTILATLLLDRDIYDQLANDVQFESVQAQWIWRTVRDHVDKYDELPSLNDLKYYVKDAHEQLQSILPTYIDQLKAVNVSAFTVDQVKEGVGKSRIQHELNRILDAADRGNYEDVLQEIANRQQITTTACKPVKLSELPEIPDPKPVTEWLGWQGESTLLDGGPKAGKSTIGASDCAAMLCNGGTVLWISADEPLNTIVRRVRKLRTIPDDPNIYVMHRKLDITWDNIHRWAEELQPDVIYCDAFHSLTARLEGKIPQNYEMEECRKIADKFTQLAERYNCAVVVFIHQPKNGDGAAGSVQIQAAFDMLATIKQARGSTTKPVISYVGRFESETVHLEYRGWEDGCTRIATQATVDPLTEILELINSSPASTYDGLYRASKIPEWRLRKHIVPELRRNGWITENGGKGQQSKIFEVSEAGRAMLKPSSSTSGNQATLENPHET